MKKKTHSTSERLRKPVSALTVLAFIVVALTSVPREFNSNWGEVMEFTGCLFLILAGLGRVWCLVYIAGRKNQVLCKDGPYSLCRNPLYLFSFIGMIGVGFALQSFFLTIIICALFLVYYASVIHGEEDRLAELFGEDFDSYRLGTPRFIPTFQDYRSGAQTMTISTRAVERGLREVFWFFAIIIAVDAIELMHTNDILALFALPF
ncbi:methyltransferase family protein [Cerasicoccus maritimus]|uniref:methyltransferase family protein n=1 Tax=Cerasicoccus maritimus TaxID=490089 RepID=UPI0028528F25|nr:isoprenylcysteine carboxylmethyltransferase family protein [Cerasicoccus maritimus]